MMSLRCARSLIFIDVLVQKLFMCKTCQFETKTLTKRTVYGPMGHQPHVRDLRMDEYLTMKQSGHVSMKICKSYGQNPEIDPNYQGVPFSTANQAYNKPWALG